MLDTPADILNLADNGEAYEDLGVAVTAELREWMNNRDDPRSDGEAAVDFIFSPVNVDLVAPVLTAAGWRPPEPPASPDALTF